MKQYILLGGIAVAILVGGVMYIPQHAGAEVSANVNLEYRIQELLNQIALLKNQAAARAALQSGVTITGSASIQASEMAGATSSSLTPRVCKLLTRTLAQGSTGEDVKGLQEYLRASGYLTSEPTGYYGPMTEKAVSLMQASEGVSSVGVVGPLTRERIMKRCVIDPVPVPVPTPTPVPVPEKTLVATPGSGAAPLTVTFSTWISGFRAPGISYTLDFGDGTSITPTSCPAPADACTGPGKDTHVYTKDGTYTATLYRITDICNGNPLCMAPIKRETVGTATVVVGLKACTLEYNPVCGSKPIVCITTPCNPIQQTYGNRCAMEADGATFLYTGECKVGSKNLPPVISSLSGPTTLDVGEKGVWTVKASDPEKGALTYSITWGDEANMTSDSVSGMAAPMMRMTRQTTTFSHSYARAGEYTIRIVVSDKEGNTAESTATVQVGDETVACTEEYAPVCGLPPGCVNSCPPGMYCAMLCQMPTPVTYSNTCKLNAAGATKLYEGACNGSIYPSM